MELRPPSPRPTIVVDQRGRAQIDPTTGARVGLQGPFGRERLLHALPLPWAELSRGMMVDAGGPLLADPRGSVAGLGRVYVPRMLSAGRVEDTRR